MAIPAGLEPATPCLEGRCSIQLSYGISRTGGIIKHDFANFQDLLLFFRDVAKIIAVIARLELALMRGLDGVFKPIFVSKAFGFFQALELDANLIQRIA